MTDVQRMALPPGSNGQIRRSGRWLPKPYSAGELRSPLTGVGRSGPSSKVTGRAGARTWDSLSSPEPTSHRGSRGIWRRQPNSPCMVADERDGDVGGSTSTHHVFWAMDGFIKVSTAIVRPENCIVCPLHRTVGVRLPRRARVYRLDRRGQCEQGESLGWRDAVFRIGFSIWCGHLMAPRHFQDQNLV
jgi:hypothetical protein